MVNGKYWNEKIETMPAEELKVHQLKKLKETGKALLRKQQFLQEKI